MHGYELLPWLGWWGHPVGDTSETTMEQPDHADCIQLPLESVTGVFDEKYSEEATRQGQEDDFPHQLVSQRLILQE